MSLLIKSAYPYQKNRACHQMLLYTVYKARLDTIGGRAGLWLRILYQRAMVSTKYTRNDPLGMSMDSLLCAGSVCRSRSEGVIKALSSLLWFQILAGASSFRGKRWSEW